ncbi:MAG: DUF3822 family protein [Gemmatimonadaceae bacterium]|nr:DUF3822 family protein [Chitinophagaceae bacterium]
MTKTLFNIPGEPENADWQQCRLTMEVGRHLFSYAVTGHDNRLLRLRSYEMENGSIRDLADGLDEVISNDPVLREEMNETVVMYNFPESQFVPEEYFDINLDRDWLDLLQGDCTKGTILSEKIPGWKQYNVFRVPGEIHPLFQRRFTNGKYWHYYSLLLKCNREKFHDKKESLQVIFYPDCILTTAVDSKGLQLLQRFPYQTAEDVCYYLLNVCAQLGLNASTVPLGLSGMLDESSAVYNEMFKYFGGIRLEEAPAAAAIPGMEAYPPHFFSPILKLASCVS